MPNLALPRTMQVYGKVQMNASLAGTRKSIVSEASGELEQMGVQFREVDPFNLWVSPKPAKPSIRTTS